MQITVQDIFDYINAVRKNINSVLPEIKTQFSKFETSHIFRNKNNVRIRTVSSKTAWQDCIVNLERQKSMPPLLWRQELAQASKTYQYLVKEQNIQPFEMIRSYFNYTGKIVCTENELNKNYDLTENMIAILVCDGDDKKASRTAIFHPLYRQFGCSISQQGSKFRIHMIFAESIRAVTEISNPRFMRSRNTTGSNFKFGDQLKGKKSLKQEQDYYQRRYSKENKRDFIEKGKMFIVQLNKIRKQPKQYVKILKAQVSNFKDDKIHVTENGDITTKEGKKPYQDLISEMEEQYPLPIINESMGLTITALQQFLQSQTGVQNKFPMEDILKKFCLNFEGIRSIKLTDINNIPIQKILQKLLVGDGDLKRTARHKLLSPICKVIGCCISKQTIIINIGEMVGNNIESIQEYFQSMDQSKNNKNESMMVYKEEEDKLINKKSSKTRTDKKNGHQYKITDTTITYLNGKTQLFVEEELIK